MRFYFSAFRSEPRPVSSTLYVFSEIMKITGYKKKDTELEGLMEMESIAIAASAETIRELAKFLNHAADVMDEMGTDYDHLHLMDEWDNWKNELPDLQVVSEKYI